MRTLAILPALLLTAATTPPSAEDVGPPPVAAETKAMVEQAIRARMIDPASTVIEWPYDFTSGSLKALFSKRTAGWITCGLVNSKNRMGGYSGQSYFELVVRNGAIEALDIGESRDIDLVNLSCQKLVKSGFLRPATAPAAPPAAAAPSTAQMLAAAQTGAQTAAATGGVGITFVPSPVGAILMAIAPGSRAEKAGLKPGETIEAINGIPVKGMEAAAIAAILHSDAPALVVKVVGVGELTIGK